MTEMEAEMHYSMPEIEDLLSEFLNRANMSKLVQIFTIKGCDARAGMPGEDVVNQIVQQVLAEVRPWPREVKPMSYFLQTGQSIISNEEEKMSRHRLVDSTDDYLALPENDREPVWALAPATKAPSADMILHSQQSTTLMDDMVEEVFTLFSDDEGVKCFLEKKLAEIVKARILELCHFTDQVYRNIEKRIKYTLRNRFPKGLPWWDISS